MTYLFIGIGLAFALGVVGAVFLLNRDKTKTDSTASDGDIAFGDGANSGHRGDSGDSGGTGGSDSGGDGGGGSGGGSE